MKEKKTEKWFEGAGFGLFIHWGIYSVAEIEASWPMTDGTIEPEAYRRLADDFNPQNYDPGDWARRAVAAGMKYVVLTTKHHDGYCLFDTKTKTFNAAAGAPGRDLLKPFVAACRAEGLKVGLYFSLIDWEDKDYASLPSAKWIVSPWHGSCFKAGAWDVFLERVCTQLEELLTNYGEIDLIWFDVPGFDEKIWKSQAIRNHINNLQPGVVINDRLPGAGGYLTPEQVIPLTAPGERWETCMTMNKQWGYHPDLESYLPTAQILRKLAEVRSKGGNFLLNVGPKADGTFPDAATVRLEQVSAWMAAHAEAIHDVEPGMALDHFNGPSTRRGNTLYLFVFDPPQYGVQLKKVRQTPKARVLGRAEEVAVSNNHLNLEIDLKAEQCDSLLTVLALDFDEPATSGRHTPYW